MCLALPLPCQDGRGMLHQEEEDCLCPPVSGPSPEPCPGKTSRRSASLAQENRDCMGPQISMMPATSPTVPSSLNWSTTSWTNYRDEQAKQGSEVPPCQQAQGTTTDFTVTQAGLDFWLSCLVAMCAWTSFVTFLCLGYSRKRATIIPPAPRGA